MNGGGLVLNLLGEFDKDSLPKLYSTEDVPLEQKIAYIKLYSPYSKWVWLILEGEETENGDFLMFGYVIGHESELGYISLKELEACNSEYYEDRCLVMKDDDFKPVTLKEMGVV
jgi:hypothetical protein